MRDMLGVALRLMAVALMTALCVAAVHVLTQPAVDRQSQQRADAALLAVLPGAERFEEVRAGVHAGFRGQTLVGHVVFSSAGGYGGAVAVTVGLDVEGRVTGIVIGDNQETANLGTKAFEEAHLAQFIGRPAADPAVDAITGATRTSNAVLQAVQKAAAEVGA